VTALLDFIAVLPVTSLQGECDTVVLTPGPVGVTLATVVDVTGYTE